MNYLFLIIRIHQKLKSPISKIWKLNHPFEWFVCGALKCHKLKKIKIKHILNIEDSAYPTTDDWRQKYCKLVYEKVNFIAENKCSYNPFYNVNWFISLSFHSY